MRLPEGCRHHFNHWALAPVVDVVNRPASVPFTGAAFSHDNTTSCGTAARSNLLQNLMEIPALPRDFCRSCGCVWISSCSIGSWACSLACSCSIITFVGNVDEHGMGKLTARIRVRPPLDPYRLSIVPCLSSSTTPPGVGSPAHGIKRVFQPLLRFGVSGTRLRRTCWELRRAVHPICSGWPGSL